MTTDNRTRERALELLTRDEVSGDDAALLTSEWHFAVELSKELGRSVRPMLATMPSRDFTDYRAAALVNMAQTEIAHAQAERKAKKGRHR